MIGRLWIVVSDLINSLVNISLASATFFISKGKPTNIISSNTGNVGISTSLYTSVWFSFSISTINLLYNHLVPSTSFRLYSNSTSIGKFVISFTSTAY